jgi:hypothetical protein
MRTARRIAIVVVVRKIEDEPQDDDGRLNATVLMKAV